MLAAELGSGVGVIFPLALFSSPEDCNAAIIVANREVPDVFGGAGVAEVTASSMVRSTLGVGGAAGGSPSQSRLNDEILDIPRVADVTVSLRQPIRLRFVGTS